MPSVKESLSILSEIAHGRGDLRQSDPANGPEVEEDSDSRESAATIAARACGCVVRQGEILMRLQYWKLLAGREALPAGGYGPGMFDFPTQGADKT